MLLEMLTVGPLGVNTVILGCKTSRKALVVDPGGDAEAILAVLERHALSVEAIFHTHAHFDHLLATGEVHRQKGGEILLHGADRELYDNAAMQARMFGFSPPEPPAITREVRDGDRLSWGALSAEVLHTPGHSPGGCCLHLAQQKLVLTGDTLFAGGIGRTDLWGGDYATLMRSIHARLMGLNDETVAIPGHGEMTTIGRERSENPFLVS